MGSLPPGNWQFSHPGFQFRISSYRQNQKASEGFLCQTSISLKSPWPPDQPHREQYKTNSYHCLAIWCIFLPDLWFSFSKGAGNIYIIRCISKCGLPVSMCPAWNTKAVMSLKLKLPTSPSCHQSVQGSGKEPWSHLFSRRSTQHSCVLPCKKAGMWAYRGSPRKMQLVDPFRPIPSLPPTCSARRQVLQAHCDPRGLGENLRQAEVLSYKSPSLLQLDKSMMWVTLQALQQVNT